MTRQSGRWAGRARICGGRANLRQALYMPALVATRFIAAGKTGKVAVTAIMRKLIIIANALLRDNRTWAPEAP